MLKMLGRLTIVSTLDQDVPVSNVNKQRKNQKSELLLRQFIDRTLIVASRGHRLSSENKNVPN